MNGFYSQVLYIPFIFHMNPSNRSFCALQIGHTPGDKKTTKVTADKAYGPYFQEMVVAFERTELPNNLRPEVGQVLQFRRSDGYRIQVVVAEVSETSVTFDGNHPLAGKDLTFEIELIEIA